MASLKGVCLAAFFGILTALSISLVPAQRVSYDRYGVPDWEVDPKFKHDVFTFARVQYTSYGGRSWGGRRGGWGRRGGIWATDYPDAELNLAFRLQQMTSMKVNPDPVVVNLTQEDLHHLSLPLFRRTRPLEFWRRGGGGFSGLPVERRFCHVRRLLG